MSEKITSKNLWGKLNLSSLDQHPEFKEDSVREVVIAPLLKALQYKEENINRSKTLVNPFLKVGTKKIPIHQYPDYCFNVDGYFAWVLDAKSPKESVTDSENLGQVYSYAAHPEIKSTYFALCNGKDFSLYRTQAQANDLPLLNFSLSEIEHYWEKLSMFLSLNSFQAGKIFTYETTTATAKPEGFDYSTRPLLEEIPVRKQAAKRHFGCNAYFTRQSWDIVNEYIKNFSKPNDLVLDCFGGSGVTAIEALMLDRKAIHIDLNPLSEFIVTSLASPVNQNEFIDAFNRIKKDYEKEEPITKEEIKKALKKYFSPKGFKLPKGSDVETIEDLFTDKQLAQLALLKYLIHKEKNGNIEMSLLLAFYNTISIINKTFHETPKGGGNHFGYYYRYRIAPRPADRDTLKTFEGKFKRILEGKKEMSSKINNQTFKNLTIKKGTATNLKWLQKESVDYIYTDPPYGKKIPYLDLSIIWNTWLDLKVTEQDYMQEAIEGGEHNKTKKDYNKLISESIKEMYRVLKYDRWMSFVFAHKDPEFWHLIIETAEDCGFEYKGAVPQKNGQSSFKKRQNPFTVLSGQLIINFQKVKNPRAVMKAHLGMKIADIVLQTIEGIIAKNEGASLEQINDELIIKGMELGFLHLLKKEYSDLTPILLEHFDYSEQTKLFTIKKDSKFKTHVDTALRIRYYLISFMRRMEREGRNPTFDEIEFNILPLLKNGVTPPKQSIEKVLKDIGEHIGEDRWKLKKGGQGKLFE